MNNLKARRLAGVGVVAAVVGALLLFSSRERTPESTSVALAFDAARLETTAPPMRAEVTARSPRTDEGAIRVFVLHAGVPLDSGEVRLYRLQNQQFQAAGKAPITQGMAALAAEPGDYLVAAHAEGFAPRRVRALRPSGAADTRVTVELSRGAELRGRVVGKPHNDPVPLAEVFLELRAELSEADVWEIEGGEGDESRLPAEERPVAISDPKGVVIFKDLARGWYDATAIATGYAESQERVEVPRQAEWVIELGPASFVTGRVLDDTGTGVAEAEVTARAEGRWRARVERPYAAVTGPTGAFSMEVAGGAYWLSARKGSSVGSLSEVVAVGRGATRSEIEIRLGPQGTIAGTVVAAASKAPIADASIEVTDVRTRSKVATSTTDLSGAYRAEQLPMGLYTVRVSSKGFSPESRDNIGLLAGGNFAASFELEAAGSIEGTVTDALRRPVAGALVHVRRNDAAARTDDAGHYRLDGVRSGETQVVASSEAPLLTAYGSVEVKPGEVAHLDLAGEALGILQGKVTDSEGKVPAQGAIVFARTIEHRTREWRVDVGADGTYRFELPAGNFFIGARSSTPNRDDPSAFQMAEIASGETKTIDLTLRRDDEDGPVLVQGTVMEADGVPSQGAWVSVQPERGRVEGWLQGMSDEVGHFVVHQGTSKVEGNLTVTAQNGGRSATAKAVRQGTRSLVITLAPGGTLRGRVVGAEPVSGFRLKVEGLEGTAAHAEAEFAGSLFELQDLGAGRARVTATTDSLGAGSAVVEVRSGTVVETEVVLRVTGKVVGRVLDGKTKAPFKEWCAVRVVPRGGEDRPTASEDCDSDGRFSVENLSFGTYLVQVHSEQRWAERSLVVSSSQAVDLGDIVLDELPRGRIGMGLDDRNDGVYVGNVEAGSPAEKGGVEVGDRIVAVNGTPVFTSGEVVPRVRGDVGTTVRLTTSREGKERTFELQRVQLDK
ncbi:MAG: carboxypeptidase regulatory-like domain-containing protein [Myxococcales bacterium]